MPRTSQITLITLFGALWPFALAILPVAVLIAVPRSPSSSGDDPAVADLHVFWVPGDAPDPADSSGWRGRVEAALDHAPDLATLLDWLEDGCNGITRDLSVEILDAEFLDADPRTLGTRPDGLSTWLQGLEEATLVEHVILSSEVEMLLPMATALA